MTVVNTPSGNSTSRSCRLLRVTPVSRSHPLWVARRTRRRGLLGEQILPRLRVLDVAQDPPAVRYRESRRRVDRGGADIDDPVRMPDDIELVFDDEERIARRLQPVERAQQRLGIGRMQSRRGSSST